MKNIQTKRISQNVALFVAFCMVPFSQAATAEVSISGWINEGVMFYDDGDQSDVVQTTDNGNTLANRITFAGSKEVATGMNAGFEVIIEPRRTEAPLGGGPQNVIDDSDGYTIGVLGTSLNVSGSWGKLTVGLQSMPTDNIAVLEDPSLTLWSGISPVFRGNNFNVRSTGATQAELATALERVDFSAAARTAFNTASDGTDIGTTMGLLSPTDAALVAAAVAPALTPEVVWGDYLNCFTAPILRHGLGIGLDCNGIYRNGIRYDLPALGPVSIAVGAANDDIYDIAAKYKGQMGRLNAQLAVGYAVNQGASGGDFAAHYDEAENFQLQAGLMDSVTGLFGSVAYQHEEADLTAEAVSVNSILRGSTRGQISDESDAWWIKVGIKRQFNSFGDTSIAFDYGQYYDQYSVNMAIAGATGSELERIGVSIDQYFGDSLIIYGKWESLEGEVDGGSVAQTLYSNGDELDTFTLGFTYFF